MPESWEEGKQVSCCRLENKGCTTTTAALLNCQAGFENWEEGWSPGKKEYCCEKEGLACDAFDCAEGGPLSWANEKQAFCCKTKSLGCPTTTQAAFDCDVGAESWEADWTDDKKKYCCAATGVSCNAYDC